MKYAFVFLVAILLIGCDTKYDSEHKAGYAHTTYAKLCVDGVTYLDFGGYKPSHTVQLDRNSKIVPCN